VKNALRQASVAISASITSASLVYALHGDAFDCGAFVFCVTLVFGSIAFAIGGVRGDDH